MNYKLPPTVSILIPVYNVEKYIRKCLDSVASQTFADWECWLIDDGSTDSSADICDEYVGKDCRFHVIHKANGGLSSARQCGMDHAAKTEYVVMIDSDDWVETDYLSSMVNAAKLSDSQIVLCDYFFNQEGKERYVSNKPTDNSPLTIQNETLKGKLHAGLWCKMFKRSLFSDYDLRWPKYSFFEDMYMFVSVLQYAERIAYLPKATYHYRFNPSSYTNDANIKRRFQMYFELFENMKALNEQYNLDKKKECVVSFNACINNGKRHLILRYFDKEGEIRPLLRYFPKSMKLHYCRNVGDIIYLFASRNGFFLPYKIRRWCQSKKT